jgi:acyl-CoA dehydrogenase
MTLLVDFVLLLLALWLLYRGLAYWAWVAPIGLWMVWWRWDGTPSPFLFFLALIPYLALAVLFGVPSLRRRYVTRHVLRAMAPIFPAMSETERTALEAGTTWWDADLFSGAPDWQKLVAHQRPGLSNR